MTHPTAPARPPRPAARASALDLHDVVAAGTAAALAAWLAGTRAPRTRADQLADLSDAEVRAVVRLLDPGTARTLRAVPADTAGGLVAVLDAPTATDLLRLLDEDERAGAEVAVRRSGSAAAHGLLAWPAGSAAARMQPVDDDLPASAAVSQGATPSGGAAPSGGTALPAAGPAVGTSTPATAPPAVRADTTLAEAVALLAGPDAPALAVLDGDRRIGTLTAADVADLLDAPAAPAAPPATRRGTPLTTRLRGLLRRR
jgi:Mg/Co/Ni transporter MgtE